MQLWHKVLGFYVNLEEKFKSPYRKDPNAGCWLTDYYGTILYIDFGDKERSNKSVFQVHAINRGITTKEAFKELQKEGCEIECISDFIKIKRKRERSIITPNTCEWNKLGIRFWNNIGLRIEDLEGRVTQVDGYYKGGNLFQLYHTAFAYWYEEGSKIYIPGKKIFFGNVNKKSTWSVRNGAENRLILKSAKDQLVAESIFKSHFDYDHVQGEKEIFLEEGDYKINYILFDPDETGIETGEKLKWKSKKLLYIPMPWKDPSGYIKEHGKFETFKIIMEQWM